MGTGIAVVCGSATTLLTGLVAYWKMDEASGTIYDSTSNNHDSTACTAVYGATGKIGDALQFISANNDYVTIPSHSDFNLTDKISISCWFNPSSLSVTQHILVREFDGATILPYMFGIYAGDDSVQFGYYNSGYTFIRSTRTTPFSIGTLYHIVITVDCTEDEVCFYINSVGETPVTGLPASLPTANTDITIGGYNIAAQYSNCILDEIGIWNKVLTQAEVDTLYASGSGLTYPF